MERTLVSTSCGGTARSGRAVCARIGDAKLRTSAQTAQAVFTAHLVEWNPQALSEASCLQRDGDLMVPFGQSRDNLGVNSPAKGREESVDLLDGRGERGNQANQNIIRAAERTARGNFDYLTTP
jgi:hypothetical protein